jgi:hypothetical protein
MAALPIARARLMVLLLTGLAACRASTAAAPSSTAPAEPGSPMAPGNDQPAGALGSLAPDKLMQRLMDEMSSDPRFSAAGDRVWKRLEEDPGLVQRGTALLERVTESPAFQQLLTRELAAGKTPEQIGRDLEQRMTRVFADPLVDRTIDETIDAQMERPKVQRASHFWALMLVKESGVSQALAEVYLSPRWRRKWEAILGVQPTPAMLFQRIDSYLMSREGQWAAQIIGDSLARDPLAKDLFLRALESPALTAIAIELSGKLLEDPTFQDETVKLLFAVMEQRSPQVVSASVRRILGEVPAVEDAVATSFLKMATARDLNQQVGADIRRLVLNMRDREELLEALTPTERARAEPARLTSR